LCGPEGFRKGTDLYFSRHDGQAITCVDWLKAIHETNPDAFEFEKFSRWYSQAGTPEVNVKSSYSSRSNTLTLTMTQYVPPTHKQPNKLPATIPITTGLIGPDGDSVLLDFGDGSEPAFERVLVLSEESQKFVLRNVPRGTLPSMLRNFSAPIKMRYEQGEDVNSLAFQMKHDVNDFNRWEAGQKLAMKVILECFKSRGEEFPAISKRVIEAFRSTLSNDSVAPALRAQLLYLPSESYLIDQVKEADPVRMRKARSYFKKQLAKGMEEELWSILRTIPVPRDYSLDPEAQGSRALRNISLGFLGSLDREVVYDRALKQVQEGRNMTDVQAGLVLLAGTDSPHREVALKEFYEKWKKDRLVLDKWMQIQATSSRQGVLRSVKDLMKHDAFDITIPNCVYAVIRAYAYTNLHMEENGEGYNFLADQIIRLDKMNPQVAAKVARAFTRIKKYDVTRQLQMRNELLRIKSTEGLSKDVTEVVTNCLEA